MKKRILIVDDERNIRTTLKMCLSGEEYETETAADGEEGLKKAEEILKQAVGKDPSSPVTHNLLGVISEYKGDVQQAQKYYRAALALDPTYEPAESNIRRTVEFDYSTAGIKLD